MKVSLPTDMPAPSVLKTSLQGTGLTWKKYFGRGNEIMIRFLQDSAVSTNVLIFRWVNMG